MEPLSGEVGSERYGFEPDSDALPISQPGAPNPAAATGAEAGLRQANEKLRAELAAARQEIERERARLEEKQREVVELWEKKISELETLQAELTSERATLRARFDSGEEPLAAEPAAEEPEAEIEDTANEPAPERESWPEQAWRGMAAEGSEEEPPAREVAMGPRQVSSGDEPTEDESIEEYFAALLNRNRSSGSPGGFLAPETAPRRRRSDAKSEQQKPLLPPPSAAVETPAHPVVLSELARRERTDVTDQSAVRTAMRELANAQARAAIHTHSRKQLVRTLVMRLAGAAICFVGGMVGMNLAFVSEQGLGGAAMAAMVVAIYLLFLGAKDGQQILTWLQSRETGTTTSKDALGQHEAADTANRQR